MSELCFGNCEGCPLASDLAQEYGELSAIIDFVGERAMSDSLEQNAPGIFEAVQSQMGIRMGMINKEGEVESIDTPDDLVRASRMSAANIIEAMDEDKEGKKSKIDYITDGCPGPLSMRAERDGVIVKATVCMSPQAPDKKTEEIAYVTRTQRGE